MADGEIGQDGDRDSALAGLFGQVTMNSNPPTHRQQQQQSTVSTTSSCQS
uniref:Uncharacterized protein n=1 Tax=Amphimedon queenslandica TaxID=400682 RepID=A0A1X7SUN7_AMPQE